MTTSYPPPPVLYEDEAIVAFDKPAGLPTANAERGQESLYTILKRSWPQGAFIGIVSRLDAAVSGVVVVAKTSPAAAGLAEQFRNRTVEKTYRAIVEGRFPAPLGTWVEWHDEISRRPGDLRSTVAHSGPAGDRTRPAARCAPAGGDAPDDDEHDSASDSRSLPAHVQARVVHRAGEVSLVELKPSTGRRHQLRVQLASRRCPIVGDRLYAARLPFPRGIALHATALVIEHPTTGETIRLQASLPRDWRERFPALFPPQAGTG
jgi:23S rRNA pseudouridine1911/1915/1917 synthase